MQPEGPPTPGGVEPRSPSQSSSSHRTAFRRRRARRWILSGVLVLVAIAAIPLARPIHRTITRWQASNILSQAEELARQQMFVEAIERLDTALQLDPRSTDALRALAKIYSRFELPYALPVWRALLALPGHTDEDTHGYISLALSLQRFDLAEAELAGLLRQTNTTPATRIQATEFFYRQGDFGRALQFARDLRRGEPTNRLHQLRVARILLNLPDPARQREGIQELQQLEGMTAVERLNLFDILAEAPNLPLPETRELLSRIPASADMTPAEYFLRADARLRVETGERDAILSEAVTRYGSAGALEQSELCQWLSKVGAWEQLLATVRFEDAHASPPMFANYLEALARTGRWEDLQKAASGDAPLDEWMLGVFRAVAATALRQDALAREHWRRAFEAARGHSGRTRALGDLSFKLGAVPQAIEAFNELTKDRLHRVTAYRRLAGVYERTRDTQSLRRIMREWAAHVPDDPLPENAFCYLSALLRKEVEVASERARRLHERQPNRLTYRTTLGLLELRRDQPRAALQLFERVPLDVRLMSPQTRLVYAVVLNANGRGTAARELIKDLPMDRLLPQEVELVRGIHAGG